MRTRSVVPVLLLSCMAAGAAPASYRLEPAQAGTATRLGSGWLSSEANDYNLSTDARERLLVFGRSTTADFSDARIWISRRTRDGWADPAPAAFSDPRWRDSDPWLTPDGRWLYFVSNRPAPGRDSARDDLDLWRARVTRAGFGPLEHLAAPSSAGEELGPEVHGGALTFNSTRSGGPAQLALYRARLVNGQPAAAEALPAPFNDGIAQGDLTFSPDGRIALFWSIRGDTREPDLFAVHRTGTGWSAAIRLPAPFNAPGMDFTPAFSADGRALRWASQRAADGASPGNQGRADIHVIDARSLPPPPAP
ncbi:PD40 domain-containing protein [Luteimonas deserti]|uniref:PD40 domain-containing protein n=1 Tax=Luteimonas deserti TaxID=2752306 RepID=A0A7Z0QS89_9GAMM|nr:PD40 domain-containing protein [Luteimonas deserti]NYZ63194.1 PD40 domain-containing protein [Luteimonas deserti]